MQGEYEPPLACLGFNVSAPIPKTPFSARAALSCGEQPGQVTTSQASVVFPVKLAAIDPAAEAKLLRLDGAIVSGRYLHEQEGVRILGSGGDRFRALPVIASSRVFFGDRPVITVERVSIPSAVPFERLLAAGACNSTFLPCPVRSVVPPPKGSRWKNAYQFVASLPAHPVGQERFPVETPYRDLLTGDETGGKLFLGDYWQDSPVHYHTVGPEHLAPIPVRNPWSIWSASHTPAPLSSQYEQAPPDDEDVQFRRLHHVVGSAYFDNGVGRTPVLRVVGRSDPEKLPGFSPLSQVPLETYYPPELLPANAASRAALHGKPLLPTQNLGDYISQPPLMLTTLKAFRALFDPTAYSGVPSTERRAPIAAIRVKVAGVTGPDQLSLERIKVVAQKIHAETGLAVDITAGSSPHPVLISLPKGTFGRPPLQLREGWSKKGVTVSFLRALDRKDLALFALILVVCALFLGNGAFASVRARRAELGALATLGWSPAETFRMVLAELAVVGLAAGLAGAGLAATLVAGLGLDFPLLRTLFVLPIAVGLAVVAGLLPAWQAARGRPLDAVRPPVSGGGRGRRVRGLTAMALVDLARLPVRTLVGAAGLALGVAALTVMVAIERGFQGTLVGTVLGNAVSLQVRGADFVALGLTVALAALSAADVLYLNVRERQAELVTLATLGWSDCETRRLLVLEALALALAASVAGGCTGLLAGGLVLGVGAEQLGVAAVIAAGGATVAALVASVLPLLRLRGLAAPEVLAAE